MQRQEILYRPDKRFHFVLIRHDEENRLTPAIGRAWRDADGLDQLAARQRARYGVDWLRPVASCELRATVALQEARTGPVRINIARPTCTSSSSRSGGMPIDVPRLPDPA